MVMFRKFIIEILLFLVEKETKKDKFKKLLCKMSECLMQRKKNLNMLETVEKS